MKTAKEYRSENLQTLKKEVGTLAAVAERAGTSASHLGQIVNGARGMGDALARKLEDACGKPWGWMDRPHGPYEDLPVIDLPSGTFRRVVGSEDDRARITLIPKVRLRLTAGISGFQVESEIDDDSTSTVPTPWLHARGFKKEHLIAIDVRGESMEPTFYAGDTAVLNTADKEPVDGAVFAINYEGEPVVKRMIRDAGQWWLTSDNADQRRFPRKLCEGDGCIIIGRVVRKESERF